MTFPLLVSLCLPATAVTTEPIGFTKVTCLANSDTVVGVPLRQQGSLRSTLTAVPGVSDDSATITLTTGALTAGTLTGHYLKFIDGDRAGRWYDIQTTPANTTSVLTINLNGDTLGAATTGDTVIIAEYWTLDTLFPPAAATIDPATTGHAIVASSGTSLRSRRTEVLLPDIGKKDINLSAKSVCYIAGGAWVSAIGDPNPGSILLVPDSYIIIRHRSSVLSSTVFRCVGEVEMGNISIPLSTRTNGDVDCHIAIPRPVDIPLSQLNLIQSGAFVPSSGTSLRNRKDQLFFYDNTQALFNKSPSAIYYHNGTEWLNALSSNSPANSDIIPAGAGFVIRKAKTVDGATAFWNNPANYTP